MDKMRLISLGGLFGRLTAGKSVPELSETTTLPSTMDANSSSTLTGSASTSVLELVLDFDYFVIGGGAAGTSGAYTLAESGARVLLLERGQSPQQGYHPMSLQLDGAGVILNDTEGPAGNQKNYSNSPVRQVKVEPYGVRSHTANLLGGGPLVNMGILLHEGKEYWKSYQDDWAFPIEDTDAWLDAHTWAMDIIASPVAPLRLEGSEPGNAYYDDGTKEQMAKFYSQRGPPFANHRSIIEPGRAWNGMSLFDYKYNPDEPIENQIAHPSNSRKNLADALLTPETIPPSLTVLTNHEIKRVSRKSIPSSKEMAMLTSLQDGLLEANKNSMDDQVEPINEEGLCITGTRWIDPRAARASSTDGLGDSSNAFVSNSLSMNEVRRSRQLCPPGTIKREESEKMKGSLSSYVFGDEEQEGASQDDVGLEDEVMSLRAVWDRLVDIWPFTTPFDFDLSDVSSAFHSKSKRSVIPSHCQAMPSEADADNALVDSLLYGDQSTLDGLTSFSTIRELEPSLDLPGILSPLSSTVSRLSSLFLRISKGLGFMVPLELIGDGEAWIPQEFEYCLPIPKISRDGQPEGKGLILAAGALETPLILMRSGIGPTEELEKLQLNGLSVPSEQDINGAAFDHSVHWSHHPTWERIGRDITDRYMTFTTLFTYQASDVPRILTRAAMAELPNPLPPLMTATVLPPDQATRVEQNRAASRDGPLWAPWEDLGGGDTVVGVGLSTRIFFPPYSRSDPNITLWTHLLGACMVERWYQANDMPRDGPLAGADRTFLASLTPDIFDRIVTAGVCDVLIPVFDCFRSSRAFFTMESSPFARGHIDLSDQATSGLGQWETKVHLKYLSNEDDLVSHVESLKHLMQGMAENENYIKMTETTDATDDCPLPIMRSFVTFLTGNLLSREVITNLKKAFNIDRASPLDRIAEVWSELDSRLFGQTDSFDQDADRSRMIHSDATIYKLLSEVEKREEAIEGQKLAMLLDFDQDEFSFEDAIKLQPSVNDPISTVVPWLLSLRFTNIGRDDDCDVPYDLRSRSLPPLPCKLTAKTVTAYTSNYGTSLWHWLGSVRRGSDDQAPVDQEYRLKGAPGIYVIDGSTFPHNMRMNPQVSVMAGGRYAGQTISGMRVSSEDFVE